MNGFVQHLLVTLRLNFRAGQALVYGYLVPVLFLLAFGSVFRSSVPPLAHEMGQLLTITVLGGACFGMPTAMVAERERGVWRRYRLLPAATGGLIVSAMVARYLLVASAAVLQMGLAWCIYRTPLPALPVQMALSFTCVCFAFLGMGLVIAMLADTVPAVQALGQAVFLPMIMIGGVGVPLSGLPVWAREVAGFFPGRYAVAALQACMQADAGGLRNARFSLVALGVIGLAACVAGAMMFRWDAKQRLSAGAKLWVVVALLAWGCVGVVAEVSGRSKEALAMPRTVAPGSEKLQGMTKAVLNGIDLKGLPADDGIVAPVALSLTGMDPEDEARLKGIEAKLPFWGPGWEADTVQRVRNWLCVCAIPDSLEDPLEGEIPLAVFGTLEQRTTKDDLEKALGWIILHPNEGAIETDISQLGVVGRPSDERIRERCVIYAKKLLLRLMGKAGGLDGLDGGRGS